jgi:hypothetical protein
MAGAVVQDMLSGMPYSLWRKKRKVLDSEFLFPTPIRKEDYPSCYETDLKKLEEANALAFLNAFLKGDRDKGVNSQIKLHKSSQIILRLFSMGRLYTFTLYLDSRSS